MLYRLRNALEYRWFQYRSRALASPPLACAPDAQCQIHTVLTHRDIPMYLVALKSLLRYHAHVAVVVHSDGTLTAADRSLLQRHLPGISVIMADEADNRARQVLGTDSYLWRWRAIDCSWRRLVDTELWSTGARRLIMDADVLVVRRPDEVIEWMERGTRPLLLGQPPRPSRGPGAPDGGPQHIQTIFTSRLDEIGSLMGRSSAFLDGTTGGFYGCASELSLPHIEKLLRVSTGLGIPMEQWGGEQCTVIYLLSTSGAFRLPPDRCFNYSPASESSLGDAQVVHFYGTHRFHKGHYPSLAAQIVSTL